MVKPVRGLRTTRRWIGSHYIWVSTCPKNRQQASRRTPDVEDSHILRLEMRSNLPNGRFKSLEIPGRLGPACLSVGVFRLLSVIPIHFCLRHDTICEASTAFGAHDNIIPVTHRTFQEALAVNETPMLATAHGTASGY